MTYLLEGPVCQVREVWIDSSNARDGYVDPGPFVTEELTCDHNSCWELFWYPDYDSETHTIRIHL
jgi:hypothetical protein